MKSVIGVTGELCVYGLAMPCPLRPYTPPELDLALRRGHARLLTKTQNLVTDIGLDALAGLFGGWKSALKKHAADRVISSLRDELS